MSVETFHDGRVILHGGDCLEVLARLPENSVDSVCTDPPYHLASIVKRFGGAQATAPKSNGETGVYKRAAKGFMGKTWDGGQIAHEPATWAAIMRVLKPGGHLVAFHATKNWHRQVLAIEEAGFEIRDNILNLYSPGGLAERFMASLSADQQQALLRLVEAGDPLGDLFWMFGSGFPKSHNVARAIDKRRREDDEPRRVICRALRAAMEAKGLRSKDMVEMFNGCHPRLIDHWAARDTDSQPATPTIEQWQVLKTVLDIPDDFDAEIRRLNERKGQASDAYLAADVVGIHEKEAFGFTGERFEGAKEIRALSEDAGRYEGWGTALKPAYEPIVLARKPFRGSVADSMQEHGTGAINIDGCRIAAADGNPSIERRQGGTAHLRQMKATESNEVGRIMDRSTPEAYARERPGEQLGRWPANVTHDGSAEVRAGFPDSKSSGGSGEASQRTALSGAVYCGGFSGSKLGQNAGGLGDSGSAARFFYSAKADSDDRLGSKHPTVKPIDLMRWLVRMITPPGGVVLDPFAGTGTTAQAAFVEGFDAILIEREEEYRADIRRRMDLMLAGPVTKAAAINDATSDYGPLFGGNAK